MALAFDAQHVVAQRLALLATGGPNAGPEAARMVAEKVAALGEAQTIAARAAAQGRADGGAAEIMRLYRRRVRANKRRLGDG